ncbi:MAG: hypothetical protein FVQ78_00475 [Solirubrobacterales bacterium]|nr:hypothetical protein [Solirubrobacterales bacterium]
MNENPHPQDDFPSGFEAAFARLRVRVEEACAGQPDWPAQVAAATCAALDFAAAEPAAARLLTSEALAYGVYGALRYRHMIEHFAEQLAAGRDHRRGDGDLPAITEEALIGAVATVITERLRRGEEDDLAQLAPELVELTLTPHLGAAEAKRIAATAEAGRGS